MLLDILKQKIKNLINYIRINSIDTNRKEYILNNLNSGKIEEVLSVNRNKFYTCPKGYPSEYCTKENIEEEYIIRTTTGVIFRIVQIYKGLNFEAPCDDYEFSIFNKSNELIYFYKDSNKSMQRNRNNHG